MRRVRSRFPYRYLTRLLEDLPILDVVSLFEVVHDFLLGYFHPPVENRVVVAGDLLQLR